MPGPYCEVCGRQAIAATIDTIISESPVADDQGRLRTVMSKHGGYRVRCLQHPHGPRHLKRAEFDRIMAKQRE